MRLFARVGRLSPDTRPPTKVRFYVSTNVKIALIAGGVTVGLMWLDAVAVANGFDWRGTLVPSFSGGSTGGAG